MSKTPKKKVFIASSNEAKESRALEPIIKVLRDNNFEPCPWYITFPPGEIIIKRLLDIVAQMDFAIFFFAEDMQIMCRNKVQFGTSWNVILEYGMFLNRLGSDRVRIIQYGDAEIPTDLGGLVVNKINSKNYMKVKSEIEIRTQEIVKQWKCIPSIHNDKYGVNKSISEHINILEEHIRNMSKEDKRNGLRDGIRLDSRVIVDLYINALEKVQKRFWTTTMLSSGFWINKNQGILDANQNMLHRLSKVSSKSVRRLFVLDNELRVELEILRRKLVDCIGEKSGSGKLADLRRQFDNLQRSCILLMRSGCEMKFVYDHTPVRDLHNHIIHGKTEIAIYDDFRIDFYNDTGYGNIHAVEIFTDRHKNFANLRMNTERHFEEVWERGESLNILLREFEILFNKMDKKVDYTIDKLFMFDNDLNQIDQAIKQAEMDRVLSYLESSGRLSSIRHYLDIGTCTGRFPFELSKRLKPECNILGIDSDDDCISYISVKKKTIKNEGNNVDRVNFSLVDFIGDEFVDVINGQHFDLMTCGLGTISHFEPMLDSNGKGEDGLQKALSRMHRLLNDNGLLIISNWTLEGIKAGMLSIYTRRDISLLKAGTLPGYRLEKKLLSEGFSVESFKVGVYNELEVFFCRK